MAEKKKLTAVFIVALDDRERFGQKQIPSTRRLSNKMALCARVSDLMNRPILLDEYDVRSFSATLQILRSNSADPSRWICRSYVRWPRILREVSADDSWTIVTCCAGFADQRSGGSAEKSKLLVTVYRPYVGVSWLTCPLYGFINYQRSGLPVDRCTKKVGECPQTVCWEGGAWTKWRSATRD